MQIAAAGSASAFGPDRFATRTVDAVQSGSGAAATDVRGLDRAVDTASSGRAGEYNQQESGRRQQRRKVDPRDIEAVQREKGIEPVKVDFNRLRAIVEVPPGPLVDLVVGRDAEEVKEARDRIRDRQDASRAEAEASAVERAEKFEAEVERALETTAEARKTAARAFASDVFSY